MTAETETALLDAARAGDRDAFGALVEPHMDVIRSFLMRMVCVPADAEDLAQDTLIKAMQAIGTFRGDSSVRSWLLSIASRAAIDKLRHQRRWRVDAQIESENRCRRDPAMLRELVGSLGGEQRRFDAREHIAFCFTCVARSLPPQESAALFLTDVFGCKGRESARQLDVSESVFRHRLAAARRSMKDAFDGLCSLVNKNGVCHQCRNLQGGPVSELAPAAPLQLRLDIVRTTEPFDGSCDSLHRLQSSWLSAQESSTSDG